MLLSFTLFYLDFFFQILIDNLVVEIYQKQLKCVEIKFFAQEHLLTLLEWL